VAQEVRRVIIEVYSADEIQALTDAYTSPVGRSILRKQGSVLSANESGAARDFFNTPIGQSILRKQQIYNSQIQPILKKEWEKAAAKIESEHDN
jgi:hypothetical protein